MDDFSNGALLALIAAADREMDWIDGQFGSDVTVTNDRAVALGYYKLDLAAAHAVLIETLGARALDDDSIMSSAAYRAAIGA